MVRYNNSLAGELIALKHNISASDLRITDTGFGDLVYRDPGGRPNPYTNKTLRQIAVMTDSALTLWRDYGWLNYAQLDTTLRAINCAFSGKVDTFSTRPLAIKPTRALFSVAGLIANPDTAPQALQILYSPLTEEQDGVLEAEPLEYELSQNYPNPFNPTTTIEFYVSQAATISLKIYNTLGQEVATILDREDLDAGLKTFTFDASQLSSGVYYYKLVMEQHTATPDEEVIPLTEMKKMVLIK